MGKLLKGWLVAEEAINFDREKMEAEIVIVRPGISENGFNHRPEAIRQAVEEGIWNGSRMFIDHGAPGDMFTDQAFRRSLRDLVSKVKETWIGAEGEARGRVKFINKEFMGFAEEAGDALGISMATWLDGKERREKGRTITDVFRYVKNRSLDWVAFPAAGGAIDKFIPALEGISVDYDEIDIDELKANRPDIVAALSAAPAGNGPGDGNPPSGLTGEDVTTRITAAVESARNGWMEDYRKERQTRDKVQALVDESGLPPKAKAQVLEHFDGQLTFAEESVQSYIDQQIDVLKDAGWSGPKIKGVGQSSSGDDQDRKESASPAELDDAGYTTLAAVESAMGYKPAGDQN